MLPPHASIPGHDPARYPIGDFSPPPADCLPGLRSEAVASIAALPAQFSSALRSLDSAQLDTPYRNGGWTLRQLAHHVADSHMHAYARLRFALTEDWPTIKPYAEARWAELADARTLPVESSLGVLEGLHTRWAALLQALDEADWQRGYRHPENGPTSLDVMTQLYSWHGRHHTAHVLRLRERMGW